MPNIGGAARIVAHLTPVDKNLNIEHASAVHEAHLEAKNIEHASAVHEADGQNTNPMLPAKTTARYNHPPPGVNFPLAHKRRKRKLTTSTMAKGKTPTLTPKPAPYLTPSLEKRWRPQKRRRNPTSLSKAEKAPNEDSGSQSTSRARHHQGGGTKAFYAYHRKLLSEPKHRSSLSKEIQY
jgi:hypothetical protein